jgi:hypothetical protein
MAVKAEISYIMIKPDGVQRGLVGDIISRYVCENVTSGELHGSISKDDTGSAGCSVNCRSCTAFSASLQAGSISTGATRAAHS